MLRSTLLLLLATAVRATTNYYDMIIMAIVNSTMTVNCGQYEDVINESIREEFLAHGIVTLPPSLSPTTAAPVTSAPTAAPVTSAPVTSAPVTSAPVTSAPVTSAPVTSAPVTSAPVTSAPVTSPPSSAPATRRNLRSRELIDCYEACYPFRLAYGKGSCYKYVTACYGGRRRMREVSRELSGVTSHEYCVKGQYAMLDAIIKTAFNPAVAMSTQCQAYFLQPKTLKCMEPV